MSALLYALQRETRACVELVCFLSFFPSCQLLTLECQLCGKSSLGKQILSQGQASARVYLHDSKTKVISEKLKPLINICLNFLAKSESCIFLL